MTVKLDCSTLTVGELLTGSRAYQMPIFQRPYAWTETEVRQLIADVDSACKSTSGGHEPEDYYFLGQLIVSQDSPSAPFEIIDGQQRLVTLCCLIATLRDLLPDSPFRTDLQAYLERPEDAARRLVRMPRVGLRGIDQREFEQWIIQPGGTTAAPTEGDTDATTRLAEAIAYIRDEVGVPRESYIMELVSYLLNNCYCVVVVASGAHDGYKIFKSINAHGQPLTDVDIARGEFINSFRHDSVNGRKLSESWDLIEDRIGIDQLSGYVKSILALVCPDSAAKPLRDGLTDVLRHPRRGLVFVETLKKFVEIFDELDSCDLSIAKNDERLNRTVACVKALPFDDWTPAALMFLAKNPTQKQALDFFRALDALGIGLLVMGSTSQTVTRRMRKVVERIVMGDCLADQDSELFLTTSEKRKILEKISRPIKASAKFIRPLLLRLNAEMLDAQIPTYFPSKVTLEHILPQKPSMQSQWIEKFPDKKKRQELSQMLGNFAILSNRANPRASNFDFHKKRERIFGTSESNVFPLTAELINYTDWTEVAIQERQEKLTDMTRRILN